MATYVVKSWYAEQKVNSHGDYVSIKGRTPGVISWVMSLMGVSPTISLECTSNNVCYAAGSWSGKLVKTIPLSKISSVYYGFTKPWLQAILIGFLGCALGGMLGELGKHVEAGAVLALIFWLLALAYYAFNKDFTIGVCEAGGDHSSINFRRSLIEGISVDEAAAERVQLIVQALVDRSNARH